MRLRCPVWFFNRVNLFRAFGPFQDACTLEVGGVRSISFGQQYTREQQDQILRVLNNSSEKELRKLSISPLNIMRILHHREENSGFASMEHVGAIDGMQTRGLARICETILYGKKPQEKRLPDRGNSIIPELTMERIESVSDIVAIDVSPPFMTWAHVTCDHFVLALERVQFLEDKVQPHLYNYYDAVQQVLRQLPPASLYVVEQKAQRHKGELAQSQSQLTVQAMLVALLSHGKQLQPQVISIKSSAITNLFDLNVGNERVSGQGMLKKLVDAGVISFQGNLRSAYFKETSVNREYFCGVLLLARAFYMLAKT
ncbi:transcription elongation factor, mitochondrial-like [Dermacentor albipictus]|uniref:transcription elongation factor, mitochondrial-like n=1 Tax=Dermacentor albipictus TaxID=60249 RepID=UPI0031FCEAB2